MKFPSQPAVPEPGEEVGVLLPPGGVGEPVEGEVTKGGRGWYTQREGWWGC